MTVIAVVSGGMDSVTLAYRCRTEMAYDEEFLLLSFDYGQRHVREIACARLAAGRLRAAHEIITLPPIFGSALTDFRRDIPLGHYEDPVMRLTVVPNRNMIMLAHAISLAVIKGARAVAIGVHGGDSAVYPDCRPRFIDAMNTVACLGNDGFIDPLFRVYAPFLERTKADIVSQGERLGVPWADTWSCYLGGERHCGECGTCTERREAFTLAGITDPTEYA